MIPIAQENARSRRRLTALSAGTLIVAALLGGPVSSAGAVSARLEPVSPLQQAGQAEVIQAAIKTKAQARRHLAKIKRLTQKLKKDTAKLKAATAKVRRVNATLR